MYKSSNPDKKKSTGVSRIKTGSFERKLSLTRTGLMVGTRMTGHLAASFFTPKSKREAKRKQALSKQARYLVEELGRLKGSVVKIGQMMALYGEHFLPPEVTEALHTLEESTVALDWPVIREVLFNQLGKERMAQLDVEQVPIGAASLGQVHCARIIATNETICLKVQYPGVAQAVDTDLNAVAQLLKIARVVTFGPAFDDWLEEVRVMMHREIDYHLEAETTAHFNELLKDDSRFVVPKVYFEFSTDQVLATRFELGENVSSPLVSQLSQTRRNALAQASLGLFLQELFVWHEIQTDPNFGNYRIRIGGKGEADQIVLLDFGAVQKYPASFIHPVCKMISSAYNSDIKGVIDGGVALQFMNSAWPESVLIEFAQVCIAVLEPLAKGNIEAGKGVFNENGEYCWLTSDLPTRIAKRAAVSAISRYFKIPPKEFVFLNRKLVGVYTFISVLDAQFNGSDILASYVEEFMSEISSS